MNQRNHLAGAIGFKGRLDPNIPFLADGYRTVRTMIPFLPGNIYAGREIIPPSQMSGDFQLNIPQQIFTLFYAITWGTAANSQPRWRAFAWGAFFQDRETRRRLLLSTVVLNAFPLIYFVFILWCLSSGAWTNVSQWNFSALWKILLSIFPTFAAFGFYRIWIGWVQSSRERFYGVPIDWKKGDPNPPAWEWIGIELKPESDLNPDLACGNFVWGIMYVIFGVTVALLVKCL